MRALLLLSLLGLMLVSPVQAQVTPLKAARDEYQFQAASYRKAYDKFFVDKAAYTKSPSNANQEILILSAKQLLAAQAQVWFSYFKALGIDLEATTGKPPETAALTTALNEKQTVLTNNLTEYNNLLDKPAVVTALSSANITAAEYRLLGAKTQALIKFYRLNYALDQLTEFKNTLSALIPDQITNEKDKESQLRAIVEAESLITEAQAAYATAITEFTSAPESSGEYLLQQTRETLTPIYTSTVQIKKILKEASVGIEL